MNPAGRRSLQALAPDTGRAGLFPCNEEQEMKSKAVGMALTLCLANAPLMAGDDYGMIMDLSGSISIERSGKTLAADLGQTIMVEDRIKVTKGAKATIVSYMDCTEWIAEGPGTVQITWENPQAQNGAQLQQGRELPVCYSQEELNIADSGTIGGLVLRGAASDPVKNLRDEFQRGRASNSSLVTLIMHDMANGHRDQAKIYLDTLRKREPGSAFVKQMDAALR
jgi:hypothetical protein